MSVLGVVSRRLVSGALTLLLVTGVVFALAHLTPGDPMDAEEGGGETHQLTAERRAELRALYHLDEPIHRQYLEWLTDVARGDLGLSFHDRRPVGEKIAERLPVTLTLNALSFFLMCLLAVPGGAVAAWKPGARWDRLSGPVTYALYAVPAFWAALLLQIVFSVRLGWLPLYGLVSDRAEALGPVGRLVDRAVHLALPVLCLTYGGLAYLSRFVRANLIESAFGEAARAARAKGVSGVRLLFHHGFRQSAVSMLTLAGFLVPGLVGGSVIVETVFAIPGLGSLFKDAVLARDVPLIMGLTLLSGTATLLGILAADLACVLADPRVRRAEE